MLVTPALGIDLLATWQSSTLGYLDFTTDPLALSVLPEGQDLDLTTVQLGVSHRWRGLRLEPFVSGGAGATRIQSDEGPVVLEDTALSLSVAGGVTWWPRPRLGARVEARQHVVTAPERLGGAFGTLDLTGGVTVGW
jgi:hypothetical protein